MKKASLIILGIFLIGLTSAVIICIDHDPPSPPTNLILTASENNIQLTWDAATDIPDCSGISHYDIYRGFNNGNLSLIRTSSDTTYLDTGLSDGTYTYIIHAWDLAGHNEGNGVSGEIIIGLGNDNNGGTSGGGGGGSSVSDDSSYWQCGNWSECIDGTQERVCVDLDKNLPDRTETKECSGGTEEITLEEPSEERFFSRITGAVTGVTDYARAEPGVVTLTSLIAILTAFLIIRRLKK